MATKDAVVPTSLKEFISIDNDSINKVMQKGISLCPPHFVDDYINDLPSVSKIINESSAETGCSIPEEKMGAFDDACINKWKHQLLEKGFIDEWDEVLSSNKSNGRKLKFQVMVLPPGLYFSIHAHPNLEFELTLFGTLHEFRWLTFRVPASELRGDDYEPITGPEIAATHFFEELSVKQGEVLINETGSVHQSFTSKHEEGCIILVLWSGVHAKIHPSKVFNTDKRLRPNVGWDSKK